MRNEVSVPHWRIIWILLFLNVVVLILALFDQGIWYVITSLFSSIGILIYHLTYLSRKEKGVESSVIEADKIKWR
ncbi:MAG: hypothetical protein EOO90_23875 [Pedobacter sp.]|nr:MAG: hypothetical protein EOO90_23875 [Pedobacter sp.]